VLALPELQSRMARALLAQEPFPEPWILEDGLPSTTRLAIYRNNIFLSLKDVLRETFPAVCRVVDERFFLYATEEFIKAFPPRKAHLSAYGDDFAGFLGRFPPCQDLPYLPDLATFEWLQHCAAHAANPPPLPVAALAAVRRKDLPNLKLRLAPSFGFLQSRWPVDRIWRANTEGAGGGANIDLDVDGVSAEIRCLDDTVVFRALPPGVFAFRIRLHQGETIDVASVRAQALDPSFDLSTALLEMLLENAVVGFGLANEDSMGPL